MAVFLALVGASNLSAAEVSSNGLGGGPWSSPTTWHGKTVPGPNDDVVIQKNDIVAFDRNDDGKVSCKKLLIDPRGGLTFKPNAGKLVLTLTDGIESYGVIRMDGTKSASDDIELRLAGKNAAMQKIKLNKGSAARRRRRQHQL